MSLIDGHEISIKRIYNSFSGQVMDKGLLINSFKFEDGLGEIGDSGRCLPMFSIEHGNCYYCNELLFWSEEAEEVGDAIISPEEWEGGEGRK